MPPPLVGTIQVTASCDLEFVASANAARSYPIELAGEPITLDRIVSEKRVISIAGWTITTDGVITASTAAVVDIVKSDMKIETSEVARSPSAATTPSSSLSSVYGSIVSLSCFLRIKNPTDPFNNSFCMHLDNNRIVVLRGPEFAVARLTLRPETGIECTGFKRIRIPQCPDMKVYISQPNSVVRRTTIANTMSNHVMPKPSVAGSILQVDPSKGELWISTPGRPVRVILGKWGLCERRRISVGSRVRISGLHVVDSVGFMCPAESALEVTEIPPISSGLVRVFAICENAQTKGCLKHISMDGSGQSQQVCKAINSGSKFNITSLMRCDCNVDCGDTQRDGDGTDISAFGQCLKDAERCISVMCLAEVLLLATPPLFRVSVVPLCTLSATGANASELGRHIRDIAGGLTDTIFTVQKPLHAHTVVRITSMNDSDLVAFTGLIDRDTMVSADTGYKIQEMIVLDTSPNAKINAVVVQFESLHQRNSSEKTCPSTTASSTKLHRRQLLEERMAEISM
jgi:hypothetical protein